MNTEWCSRRYAALAGAESYGQLVAQKFGRRGSVLLQCAIAVHVSGVMVGYNGEALWFWRRSATRNCAPGRSRQIRQHVFTVGS